MKKIFLFILVTSLTYAEDSSKVQVQTYDDYPAKSFENKDVDVKHGQPGERSFIAELPSPAQTKALIKEANLDTETTGKDQIFFDILMSRLLREKFSDTAKLYPKIDPEKLKVLKKLLEAKK